MPEELRRAVSEDETTAGARHRIRAYTPADRQPLRALTEEVWPGVSAEVFEQRWWWRWDPPPLLLVEDPETHSLLGFCAYLPFSLYFQCRTYPSAWLVDFFVSPRYQRRGLGQLLTESLMKQFAVTASLSQTDAAWATFRRLKWLERRHTKLYLNVLPLLPGALRLISKFGHLDSTLRVEAGPVGEGSIDDEFDILWQRLADRFGPICFRDRERLQRRYGQENRQYTLWRCRRDKELVGYMIARTTAPDAVRSLPKRRIGVIVDYLMDPGDAAAFSIMLAKTSERLLKEGARCLLCLCTVPAFQRVLTRSGFWHSGTPLLGRRLARLDVGFTFTTQSETTALKTTPWFLTLGDCDMDLVWPG